MTKINIIFFHKLGVKYCLNKLFLKKKKTKKQKQKKQKQKNKNKKKQKTKKLFPKNNEIYFWGTRLFLRGRGVLLTELITFFFTN